MHEIIIKKDIEERKISLFDWSKLGFEEPVSFGIEAEIEVLNQAKISLLLSLVKMLKST